MCVEGHSCVEAEISERVDLDLEAAVIKHGVVQLRLHFLILSSHLVKLIVVAHVVGYALQMMGSVG